MTTGAWHHLRNDAGARAAAAVLAAAAACAVLAPALAPYDPTIQPDPVALRLLAPSWQHPLGTDPFSRDVFSRMLHGARVSLGVAAGAMLLSVTLGTALGALAAVMGGWVDTAVASLVDVLIAMPRLLVVIALVATFGTLSPWWLVVLIGGSGWLTTARIVRAEFRDHLQREYVVAAVALGASRWRIIRRHLLPAVAPQIAITAALALAAVIPLEAALSFVGFGIQPPLPSWGNIILDGVDYLTSAWWMVVFPVGAVTITVGSALVLADRMRVAVGGEEHEP
ncbi:MAG: ABC transporter permease [Gemmatimonadetes bacterium]|nr:ABC transporter permease [Gemmatimonadota bacterium]